MGRPKKNVTDIDFIIRPYGFETDFPVQIRPDDPGRELAAMFDADPYGTLYEMGFREAEGWYPLSLRYLHRVSSAFVRHISRMPEIERLREDTALPEDLEVSKAVGAAPFISGSEYADNGWGLRMWNRLLGVFRDQISSYDGAVAIYFTEKNQDLHVPGKLFFHLVENRGSDLPFAFMATYSPESGGSHLPLKHALEEYRNDRVKLMGLLSDLSAASERSGLISELMESGELFHPLGFTPEEAFEFLKEVPIYEECGILCRIPNWWKSNRSAVGMSYRIGQTGGQYMGFDTILSFDPQLSLDGEPLTEEEIDELSRRTEGLAFLKGKWVEVDRNRLRKTLDAFEAAKGMMAEGIAMSDALRMLAGGFATAGDDMPVGVEYGEWLDGFLEKIRNPVVATGSLPSTFKAELRPYQEKGVAWLSQLGGLGLGACLADDMGLGKTVQVLAYLESTRAEGRKVLLVVPPSLLGNWKAEAERFAPEMDVGIIHGKSRSAPGTYLNITTYGMLAKMGELAEVEWDVVILDEAQAIKNRSTQQAKGAKALKGRFKIAMTGTPVENGLWDLWSIFDFANPGLLGSADEFGETISCADEDRLYEGLRRTTSPFILRRLKTDKNIIKDLPEKNEIKTYVNLTRKQAMLYMGVSDAVSSALTTVEPRARSALLLSSLTKFKQICNHPDQYLGQPEYSDRYSEKMQMLEQLCETIRDRRERVIVFTQYREMTGPLSDCLRKVFGREGLVLHGGTPPKRRSEMVDAFNNPDRYVPYMVLSLKAGGVGLNLIGANHVVHFDRWWNPAVENQATDRAYRIGQTKDVMVYKLICKGTIEESIDDMIEGKTELAENVISGGETWITRMSDGEIRELFTLR